MMAACKGHRVAYSHVPTSTLLISLLPFSLILRLNASWQENNAANTITQLIGNTKARVGKLGRTSAAANHSFANI